MTNRLSKLRANQSDATPPKPVPTQDDPFKGFWDEYNSIEQKVQDIDDTLDEIQALDEDIQGLQDQKEATDKRAELHQKLSSITAAATAIRGDIDKLKKKVDDSADENPGDAEVRLQKNQIHVLSNHFAKVFNKFTTMQDDIKSRFAKQVTRHYQIAGININEDDAERIISENPEALQQSVFTLQGNSAQMQEVVNTYNTIAARHDDILAIERSMADLMELFVQFNILVKDQGRIIDNIEANIASARNYVEKGTKHIETAQQHQKKSRKCLYIILGVAGVVLVGVILIIVFTT